MSETTQPAVADAALEALKASRSSPAVKKMELARLRSAAPALSVLLFEGDDDKIVYSQWINRVRPDLRYAMFPCGGKGAALSLRHSLTEDRTNLAEGAFFFIDRDFDDLRGQVSGPDVFMTKKYAVENYLVDENVLQTALAVEFHCHAAPGVRDVIVAQFRADYDAFLIVTKELNLRLYIAQKLRISMSSLPRAIGKIACIDIGAIGAGSSDPCDLIAYVEEPPPEAVMTLAQAFSELDPRDCYRGKFALMFFLQWLRKLGDQSALPNRGIFNGIGHRTPFRNCELTVTNFASRSPLPDGFAEFIASVPQERAA